MAGSRYPGRSRSHDPRTDRGRRIAGARQAAALAGRAERSSKSWRVPKMVCRRPQPSSKCGPDVAFLDIQMPGLNGLEVAAQLEQETAPLIVFVTAYDEHAVKAFDLNAVDYLLKPYDKDRLLRSLTRVRDRLGDRRVACFGGRHCASADEFQRPFAGARRRAPAADRQRVHRLAGSRRQLRSRSHGEPQVSAAQDAAGFAGAARRAALRAHSQIGGGEYFLGRLVHAAVQRRLRSLAAEWRTPCA